MIKIKREKYPYRPVVLGIVVNDNKQFLIVQKLIYRKNEWEFPGGGVEENETPKQALLRELKEEVGSEKFTVVSESKTKGGHEWPDEIILKRYQRLGKLFRGIRTKYFLVRFFGQKQEIKFRADEIKTGKWVTLRQLPKYLIFPGQWQITEKVIKELL